MFLKNRSKPILIVLMAALCMLIFYLDTMTPRGYLDWFFYLAVIFYAAVKLPKAFLVFFGAVSIVLSTTGFFLSPPGIPFEFAVFNRVIGILILWMTSMLLFYRAKDIESADEIKEQLKTAIDKISSGAVYFDLDGKMKMVNRKFSDILGFQPGEILNKSILALVHPDYRKEFLEAKEKIVIGLLKRDYIEAIMTKKNGEVILVNMSLNIPAGIPQIAKNIIAFVQDTEQEKNEEEKISYILKKRESLIKELSF